MSRIHPPIALFATMLLLVGLSTRPLPTAQAAWLSKLEPDLWQTAVSQPTTEFLVMLSEQADLSHAATLPTKEAKGEWVYQQLTAVANRTQPAITHLLTASATPHRTYWVANMIWVSGSADTLTQLAQRPDVGHIYANPSVQLDGAEMAMTIADAPQQTTTIQPNLTLIHADTAWNAGITGEGIVIGGQDTGYDWDHEALIQQYRGWNPTTQTADHNYHWHDAIHANNPNTAAGNPCGFDSPAPCDDNSHGTHTMGIMVGDNGIDRQIGVAPAAKWISCRNMEQGWGTPATYAECYQWFIAPTDLNNANPNPALAPHVINNSWSCPTSEGCTTPDALLQIVQNVRAAGIVTVQAAANSGPSCSSIDTPAAIYDESFTVGNLQSDGITINSSSSRGPVTIDGSGRLKPDVAAPGTNTLSSIPNDGYASKTGTSMAAPHVAGLVALLLDAYPSLIGQVDAIESIITDQLTHPLYASSTSGFCGGDTDTTYPNNVFGYGRIDAANLILGLLLERTYLPVVTSPQTQ